MDDTIHAILKSLFISEAVGEIINISSGSPVSIRTMIDKVSDFTNSGKPRYGEVPYRQGENMALYANIFKAEKILRWKPSVSLEDGLKQTIELFEKNEFKYVR